MTFGIALSSYDNQTWWHLLMEEWTVVQQRQWSGLIALMLLAWGMPVAAREPLRLNALEYPPSKTEPEILSR
ncbi:MAG: hypothetical protein AAF827_14440, partial [Cyanobacteria bacterium P01_D01_bin.6]